MLSPELDSFQIPGISGTPKISKINQDSADSSGLIPIKWTRDSGQKSDCLINNQVDPPAFKNYFHLSIPKYEIQDFKKPIPLTYHLISFQLKESRTNTQLRTVSCPLYLQSQISQLANLVRVIDDPQYFRTSALNLQNFGFRLDELNLVFEPLTQINYFERLARRAQIIAAFFLEGTQPSRRDQTHRTWIYHRKFRHTLQKLVNLCLQHFNPNWNFNLLHHPDLLQIGYLRHAFDRSYLSLRENQGFYLFLYHQEQNLIKSSTKPPASLSTLINYLGREAKWSIHPLPPDLLTRLDSLKVKDPTFLDHLLAGGMIDSLLTSRTQNQFTAEELQLIFHLANLNPFAYHNTKVLWSWIRSYI